MMSVGRGRQAKKAYSVPYLELDLLAINIDHTSPKLHTNGEIMHWLKSLVCELEQQAGFANTCKNT